MKQWNIEPAGGGRQADPDPAAPSPWRHPLPITAAVLLVIMLIVSLFGCGPLGFMAHGVAGGQKRVTVPAEYRGLEHQRVAVLVAADEYTLHQHPQAPLLVCRELSTQIAEHVPGVRLLRPQDVIDFQHEHPYWATQRYGDLLEALDMDRLVVIDLMDYRLHEPGNAHVWQGLLSATVLVLADDARDPDQPVLSSTIRAQFPEASKVGTVDSDAQAIRTGMIQRFGVKVARLFHEHEVWQ